MFRLKWQKRKRNERRRAGSRQPVRATTARKLFHGVAIIPDPNGACAAVVALANVRYLADEAPMLPVAGCGNPAVCDCKYRHFEDRRTDARRESDVGMPMKTHPHNVRSGFGRRVTDG